MPTTATITRTAKTKTHKAVWLNPDAPRPTGLYLTLDVNPVTPMPDVYRFPPDATTGVSVVSRSLEFTLAAQAFRTGAVQALLDLEMSLQTEVNRAELNAAGIAYVQTLNGVADLTGLIDSRWEERASLDLQFRCNTTVSDNVGVIETIEDLEGSYS